MKKIIFILLVFITFSFADYYGKVVTLDNGTLWAVSTHCTLLSSDKLPNGHDDTTNVGPNAPVSYRVDTGHSHSVFVHFPLLNSNNGDYNYWTKRCYADPVYDTCPLFGTYNLTNQFCSSCPSGQEIDPITKSCVKSCDPLNGSLQDGSGGCNDCSFFNDLQLRANCLCSGKGFNDGAVSPSSVSKEDINGSSYYHYEPICKGTDITVSVYLKDEDLNFNSDPCTSAISWGAVTPVGFIFKGSVSSDGACSQYVDGVNYLDSRTKKAFPDCPSNNTLYCFLKPSADNNDTGIPAPDSNQTNSDGNLDSNTSIPQLDINSTPSGGYSMATQEKTNSILGQVSSNLKSFTDKYTRDNTWWQKDNTMKFNARTANDNANNGKLISSIDSLNKSLGDKLDTLADKNTSVDLSPATTKLDQLHKDLNTTNQKLSNLNDKFDSNETIPQTGLDGNDSAPQLSELLPDDSFYSDNTLDLSGLNNYDGDCYLESFTWTDGSGVHTFPPQNVIDMIPFDVVSNLMLAFIYLLGLREFLRS